MDTLAEKLLSLLPFLSGQTDDGSFCPDTTIVGIKLQTLVKCLHSFCRVFLQQIDFCLHRIGTGIFRPTGHHRIDLQHRTVIVLLLNQTENTVMPKRLILGIIAKGTVIVLHGLGKLLLVDTAKTTKFVGTDNIRIAFDSFRTVGLCATEVIKIVFGYTTEEPRFIKPWFLTDSLIKILNGENIILIIERRTPYHHQSVCIKLGTCQYRPNNQKI